MKKGDIRRAEDLSAALQDEQEVKVDYVLHHAAFVSVPGSLADPVTNNAVNVDGFLNVLLAAKEYGVKRVVYASSSAVYGDNQALPAARREHWPLALALRDEQIYERTLR